MPHLPHHPESDKDAGLEAGGGGASRRNYAIVATVVALVLVMVVLHLTGVVGAGSH